MNIDINKLKNIKLTKEQQQYVAGAVMVVAVGVWGYWTKVMQPLSVEISAKREELKGEMEKLDQARKFSKEDYDQRMELVRTGSKYMAMRMPPADDRFPGIKRLIRLTVEDGLELTSYKPVKARPSKKKDPYIPNVANVTIYTSFHELGRFLSKLTGEDLLYLVEELKLTEQPAGVSGARGVTGRLKADLKLITFSEKTK